MLFTSNTAIKTRRSEAEFEELKKKADLKGILTLLVSMKIKIGVVNNLENWEKDFLKRRANELGIRGMREFLEFRDFKWIKVHKYLDPVRNTRGASNGRGLIPGSVMLPPAQNIGGFVYRANKRKKRDNRGKIHDDGKN